MGARKRPFLTWRVLLTVSLLLAIVAALFLSVDFQLGRALLTGVGAAWALLALVRLLRALSGRVGRWLWIAAGLLVVVGLAAAVGYLVLGFQAYAPGLEGGALPTEMPQEEPAEEEEAEEAPPPPPCPGPVVNAISIRVDGSEVASGTLTAGGAATAFVPGSEMDHCPSADGTPYSVELPERSLEARDAGLALSEVRVASGGMARAAFEEGVRISLDEPLAVELTDLPRRSFFEARDAVGVTISPYLRTETVTWEMRTSSLAREVTFTYVQPGWRFARPLLLTFYRAGSVGEFALGVAGMAGTFVLSAVLQPIIGDLALDKAFKGMRGFLKRRARRG